MPLSHFKNRTRDRMPPRLFEFIVIGQWLVGDGDAIDLRVEVVIPGRLALATQNRTKTENETARLLYN
jgi:hypothetical protein